MCGGVYDDSNTTAETAHFEIVRNEVGRTAGHVAVTFTFGDGCPVAGLLTPQAAERLQRRWRTRFGRRADRQRF